MKLSTHIIKLLTFRLSGDEIFSLNSKHFVIGLIATWVVGMGRYWDDPGASLLQHLGLGSVIYIFLLSAFIWIIVLPFNIPRWQYSTVLAFVSLTSFPAIFYAIPVERFFTMQTANMINVWFLAIVAIWRLALLYYFLKNTAKLSNGSILTITLMPVCLIISTLTVLNLHRVVFNVMGGIRNPTSHDASYLVLTILTGLSTILTIPMLIAYGIAIYNSRQNAKWDKKWE